MNKKIPTAIAISIVLIAAILAGGFVYWRYFSFQEELSNQSTAFIPKNTTQDETADWQTYRNEEYNLEFKYPDDVVLTTKTEWPEIMLTLPFPANLDFNPCNVKYIYVSVLNENIENVGTDMINTPLKDIADKEEINASNLKGYLLKGGSDYCRFYSYYFDFSGKTLYVQRNFLNIDEFREGYNSLVDKSISLEQYEEIQKFITSDKMNELFNQILSTFRFTTANWQIYTNTEYGFEVKYPPSFEKDSGCVPYIHSDGKGISIGPMSLNVENVGNTILKEYIDNYIKKEEYEISFSYNKVISRETMSLSGEPAEKISWEFLGAHPSFPRDIFLKKSNFIYNFHYDLRPYPSYCLLYENQPIEEFVSLILSTFKFIKIDITADWQTYRNDEYGIEIKYPPNWYYSSHGTCFNPQTVGPDYCTVVVIAVRSNLSSLIEDELKQYSGFTIEKSSGQFNDIQGEVFKIKDQINNFSLYRKLIIFENKDKGYIYILDGEGDSEKIFNQILSTFKFID